MNDNSDHPPSDPSPCPPHPSRRTRTEVAPEIHAEILRLHQFYGTRQIAQRVALSRKIVRRILSEHGSLPAPQAPAASGKLDPFRTSIQTKVADGLTTTRILREIRQLGYSGGRSQARRLVAR